MWTKLPTCEAPGRFACLGLACLAIAVISGVPAAGQKERAAAAAQPAGSEARSPQQMVALAERQVAIKRAALAIANAQKGIPEAKVSIAKARIQAANASLRRWEAEVKRVNDLLSKNVVDKQTVDEAQARLATARATRAEAEGNLRLAEREGAVEEARCQLARAELAEAELRHDQLRDNLPLPPKQAGAPPALLEARLEAAQKAHGEATEALAKANRTGDGSILTGKMEAVYTWSVRWLNAQRDLGETKDKRIAALGEHLERMKDLQQKAARLHLGEPAAARWYLAEAELWLAKEKAR